MDPVAQPSMLGEFRILSELGHGGSGVVYDANWGPRRVALKVLHPSLVGTGKERAQFITEAQRLQQITHPSVVKVFAVGQLPDGRPYLAMERLDGETLAAVIARGAMPLAHALALFEELSSAVAALHAQGLVHRDLKPENVFVVGNRHAVLLDFGIAKDLSAPASTTTQEGNVRGTPAYMAPERFFGQPAGIATDIYELALVLYVMLAGRLPWDDAVDPEARLSPRSLAELAPGVSEALDVEIRRALSTRAQNRPPSAMSLLEAVREAASGSVTEPGPAETARLRSGAQSQVAAPANEPGRAPSGKGTTGQDLALAPTIGGLALAPTVGAPPDAVPRRKRWPLALAIVFVGGAAGAFFVLRARDREPAIAPPTHPSSTRTVDASTARDPWAEPPKEEQKAFALVVPARTPAQYRAEASEAVQHLMSDTRFIVGMQLAELRSQSAVRDLVQMIGKTPRIAVLANLAPPCVKGLAADAEWIVFGAPSFEKSPAGTLILRGRWRRSDVEACFGETVKTYVTSDGAKLFRVGDSGWLDFLDEHTAYVTLDTKAEPESLHKLVKKGHAPVTRVKQIYSELPAARSISVALDGGANDDLSFMSLPKGSDIYGWVRVEPAGVVLDLAADPHNEAAAKAVGARLQPQMDNLFANTNPDAVGKLEVVRQNTVVHLRGNMTAFMLGIVTATIPM